MVFRPLVWLPILLLLASCGVEVDTSFLKFAQPDTGVDAAPPKPGIPCSKYYHCVYDEGMSDSALDLCLEKVKKDEEMAKLVPLEECREATCSAYLTDANGTVNCMLANCTEESISCAIGHGADSCVSFALNWWNLHENTSQCATNPRALCQFDFLSNTSPGQANTIIQMYNVCLTTVGTGTDFWGDCIGLCPEFH